MDLTLVIPALDAVVLQRTDGHSFVRASRPPSWWRTFVPQDRDGEPLVITDFFPFLEVFLPEAERAWSTSLSLPVASELWTRTGPDGKEIHLEAFAKLVDGAAVLVIARNDQAFHERQLLLQRARELRFTYDALMREIERKEILLHTIVHDLTAPLHSIVGALSLLREMQLPATAMRWTEIAVEAAARQRELVQGILDVFVSEQGGDQMWEPGGVDLDSAIERALVEREPVARKRQVELVRDVAASFRVDAEQTRLLRVLTNLLDNAIRHSPAGTRVRLGAEPDGDAVRITIEDEGPGVSKDIMPLLFQKLAHDPRGGGTGLGLYFCRITVEQWGGGIGYEPRPGGGARFWLRLRLTPAREQQASQETRTVAHG